MRRTTCAGIALLTAIAAVACGFELADVVPLDTNVDSGAIDGHALDDGGLGIDVPISPPAACADPSCFALPSGWTPIAFGGGAKGATCPNAYTGRSSDVIEGATAGACSCGTCSVTAPPACDKGLLAFSYDTSGGGCGTALPPIVADGGGCVDVASITLGGSGSTKIARPTPTGGACALDGGSGGTITFASEDRLCATDGTGVVICSDGRACAPAAAAPFALCVGKNGEQECPPGSFSAKHVVAASASASCATQCACSVTATCGGGVVFFNDPNCNGTSLNMIVDGTCRGIQGGGGGAQDYHSSKFIVSTSALGCTVDGGGSPTVTLTSAVTICCAN